MKVLVFNDKSTNRPKHSVKENVKTQGSGTNVVLCDPTLNSLAKYDKLATSKHLDSKKQLFVRERYSGTSGVQRTSAPNRELPTNRFRLWRASDDQNLIPESSRRTDLDSREVLTSRIKLRRAPDEQI